VCSQARDHRSWFRVRPLSRGGRGGSHRVRPLSRGEGGGGSHRAMEALFRPAPLAQSAVCVLRVWHLPQIIALAARRPRPRGSAMVSSKKYWIITVTTREQRASLSAALLYSTRQGKCF